MMKKDTKKIVMTLGVVAVIVLILICIRPLLLFFNAEERYLIDKYKENKEAFAIVQDQLLSVLAQENAEELNLYISYDSDGNPFLHSVSDKKDVIPVDLTAQAYRQIADSFGDEYWNKVYIGEKHITLSAEGNNCQFVYSENQTPETGIYGSGDNNQKIRKLGNDWYLIMPK